jgi:hypothetical protein
MEFLCLKACGMRFEILPACGVHVQEQIAGGKKNTDILGFYFYLLLLFLILVLLLLFFFYLCTE